jgi:teichuronic acid biosynthesis glycosyltransferase TuaH
MATPPVAAAGAVRDAGPRADARDVVFTFSYMTWAAAAARGMFGAEDRLLQTLLTSRRVRRLVVCSQARSLPLKLLRDLQSGPAPSFPADDRTHLVEPLRLRPANPGRRRALLRAVAAQDRALARAVRRHRLERPALVTSHPLLAGFGDLGWAQDVTYYAIDDWAAHPAYRRWWPAYRDAYARIRQNGRAVCGVSETVVDRIAPSGPRMVMPNGLDPSEWEAPRAPEWVAELPRPLLVYAGTLDHRLDVEALTRLATDAAGATVLLVGPVGEQAELGALDGMSNVVIRPPLPRDEVAGVIHAADAGLIPHRESALTSGMSPLKLYEYVAGGLPVAATDLAPVRGVSRRVVLSPPRGDFSAAVARALELGRASESERAEFVQANSWAERHRRLLDFALG